MKRHVIISVNEVRKYQIYIPLVAWAWRHYGWNPVLFYVGDESPTLNLMMDTSKELALAYITQMKGYETSTVAQTSRIYAGCLQFHGVFGYEDYILTSDADMLPLSDYWKPTVMTPTTWGRDLTDYHYPICYIGATAFHWNQVMNYSNKNIDAAMYTDFIRLPRSVWTTKEKAWQVDQDIITSKLLVYGKQNIAHIDRGTDASTGYPIGRVDRSHWTLNHETLIDAHLPHDIMNNDFSFKKVMDLLHHNWPLEDWSWFIKYFKEFKKL